MEKYRNPLKEIMKSIKVQGVYNWTDRYSEDYSEDLIFFNKFSL